MCEMGQCVPLRLTSLVGNGFIAAGERDRLERDKRNLLWVIQCEFDHSSDLLVVHAINDCDHWYDVDASVVEVFNSTEFHIERFPTPR